MSSVARPLRSPHAPRETFQRARVAVRAEGDEEARGVVDLEAPGAVGVRRVDVAFEVTDVEVFDVNVQEDVQAGDGVEQPLLDDAHLVLPRAPHVRQEEVEVDAVGQWRRELSAEEVAMLEAVMQGRRAGAEEAGVEEEQGPRRRGARRGEAATAARRAHGPPRRRRGQRRPQMTPNIRLLHLVVDLREFGVALPVQFWLSPVRLDDQLVVVLARSELDAVLHTDTDR